MNEGKVAVRNRKRRLGAKNIEEFINITRKEIKKEPASRPTKNKLFI